MFVETNVKGEKTAVELIPRLMSEQDETRKWVLSNANGGHPVKIVFNERAFVLQDIETLSEEIAADPAELHAWINDFLKEQLERRQSGIDNSEDIEEAEPQPYDPHKINIRNQNWSVSHMFELIDKWKQVELAPDFQRGFVWDYTRKAQLIESLMLRIPVPAFYLSETDDGRYQVVDGLQRLTAITQFLKNEFPLKYLEYLKDLEGLYFQDDIDNKKKGIDQTYWRNILQTQITVNIIEASSPAKVKFDVFRRVNTGGKPLNNQEIRNCLAESYSRQLINDLAFSDAFKKATGGSVSTSRMEAQELVLRFIGLWHVSVKKHPEWVYKGNMTEFLDGAIVLLNAHRSAPFEEIKEAFYRSMYNAEYLFGQYSFRKCLPQHLLPGERQQLINKSLYSNWSLLLSEVSFDEVEPHTQKGELAKYLAEELENDPAYFNAVSYKTNDRASLDVAHTKSAELLTNFMKKNKGWKTI